MKGIPAASPGKKSEEEKKKFYRSEKMPGGAIDRNV